MRCPGRYYNTFIAISQGRWRVHRRLAPDPERYARGPLHVFGPYLYRSEFWARSEEEECARALHHRAGHLARGSRNSRRHLAEDHPGTAGFSCYSSPTWPASGRSRTATASFDVGRGDGRVRRAGQWLALDAFDVVPDLITFAKGVNSGSVPVGGVIISDRVARHFDERVFPEGSPTPGTLSRPQEGWSRTPARLANAISGRACVRWQTDTRVEGGPRRRRLVDRRAGHRPVRQDPGRRRRDWAG
jgi:hypothetical protein